MINNFIFHPGEILKENVLEPKKLTVTEAAKLLEITRANLSLILNKKRGISANMAIRISMVFGGTPDIWLKLQNRYDLEIEKRNLEYESINLKKYEVV